MIGPFNTNAVAHNIAQATYKPRREPSSIRMWLWLVVLIAAVAGISGLLAVPYDPCLVEFSFDPAVDEYVALHCDVR